MAGMISHPLDFALIGTRSQKKRAGRCGSGKITKKNALPQPPALKKSSRVDMEYFPDLFSPLHSLQKPFVAMQVFA
jgi:hypothetical protein